MQERLREVDLRAIRQTFAADVEEALRWQETWGRWPVIVKPSMSGGMDGVHWCHSAADVRAAFAAERGKTNVNGVVNEGMLVQEFLEGTEYIVDTVTFKSRHIVCGIWQYKKHKHKETRSISYEYSQLVEAFGEAQKGLTDYVFSGLDALGVRIGAAHSEVIACADGPCLVETGVRLQGLQGPKLTELATGFGPRELVVDVFANGGRLFEELISRGHQYTLKKHAFQTCMLNQREEGVLAASVAHPMLRALPNVLEIVESVRPGQGITPTRDLATAPGFLITLHASLEQCFRDIQTLRALEEDGLFAVRAHVARPSETHRCAQAANGEDMGRRAPLPTVPMREECF